MSKNNANFKSILNPPKDFLLGKEIIKNHKHIKAVREKIFSEIHKFLENKKNLIIESSSFKDNTGTFIVSLNNKNFNLKLKFEHDTVALKSDNKEIVDSTIFGAQIDKEKLIATEIKVDLVSIKEKINQILMH